MSLSYDDFANAFLSKITEFEFLQMSEENRTAIIDNYMKATISSFAKYCTYDLSLSDDEIREYTADFETSDVDEILNIVSEGMLVQWMKPYLYKQELLENAMNTRDFTTYSPAELLLRVGAAYERVQKNYIQMVREYTYNHGDLTNLHL